MCGGLLLPSALSYLFHLVSAVLRREVNTLRLRLRSTLRLPTRSSIAPCSRATELLEYLEVADRAEHLSGGERQRVAIARALANNPAIILADKPTAALDTERGLSVRRLLRRVSTEQQTTILTVTHDTRMISEVDDVIPLMDGRMVEINGGRKQN